jgi:hypothetical protein
MKKTSILLILAVFLLMPASVFADTIELSHEFTSELDSNGEVGDWTIKNDRLYQNDTKERLAKINFQAPQRGTMEYRFTVRYEGGGIEDRMGGFGIHVFVNDPNAKRSWGNGTSYLLWVNYDPKATYGKKGFVAQVYESKRAVEMPLLEDYQMKLDASMLQRDNLYLDIPVRIQVNGNTGLVKVYDPRRDDYYYKFRLPEAPKRGKYVALRTNSLSVSFDDLEVRRLD